VTLWEGLTVVLQARSRFTLILKYELFSLLKTHNCDCEM